LYVTNLKKVYEVNARTGIWGFVDSCSVCKTVESKAGRFIFS